MRERRNYNFGNVVHVSRRFHNFMISVEDLEVKHIGINTIINMYMSLI